MINLSKPGNLQSSQARYFYLLTILKCPKCIKPSELQIEKTIVNEPGKKISEFYCLKCKNKFITIEEKTFPYIFAALLPRGKDLTKDQINYIEDIFKDFKTY
jgi:hypothetical protein